MKRFLCRVVLLLCCTIFGANAQAGQVMTWMGTTNGAVLIENSGPAPWYPIFPVAPGNTDVGMHINTGGYPSPGQSATFVVRSNFLFNGGHNVHLALAMNHETIYSNTYVPPNWVYNVALGNQANAFIYGNFGNHEQGCAYKAAFEAIYQIPRWYYSSYWGYGWYWGVTGGNVANPEVPLSENALSSCFDIPTYVDPLTGDLQVQITLTWTDAHPGRLSAAFGPPGGLPVLYMNYGGNCAAPNCLGPVDGWKSWFEARVSSMIRNPGIGVGVIGPIPVDKYITIIN